MRRTRINDELSESDIYDRTRSLSDYLFIDSQTIVDPSNLLRELHKNSDDIIVLHPDLRYVGKWDDDRYYLHNVYDICYVKAIEDTHIYSHTGEQVAFIPKGEDCKELLFRSKLKHTTYMTGKFDLHIFIIAQRVVEFITKKEFSYMGYKY